MILGAWDQNFSSLQDANLYAKFPVLENCYKRSQIIMYAQWIVICLNNSQILYVASLTAKSILVISLLELATYCKGDFSFFSFLVHKKDARHYRDLVKLGGAK